MPATSACNEDINVQFRGLVSTPCFEAEANPVNKAAQFLTDLETKRGQTQSSELTLVLKTALFSKKMRNAVLSTTTRAVR